MINHHFSFLLDALRCITCEYSTINGTPYPDGADLSKFRQDCWSNPDHPSEVCETPDENDSSTAVNRCVKLNIQHQEGKYDFWENRQMREGRVAIEMVAYLGSICSTGCSPDDHDTLFKIAYFIKYRKSNSINTFKC